MNVIKVEPDSGESRKFPLDTESKPNLKVVKVESDAKSENGNEGDCQSKKEYDMPFSFVAVTNEFWEGPVEALKVKEEVLDEVSVEDHDVGRPLDWNEMSKNIRDDTNAILSLLHESSDEDEADILELEDDDDDDDENNNPEPEYVPDDDANGVEGIIEDFIKEIEVNERNEEKKNTVDRKRKLPRDVSTSLTAKRRKEVVQTNNGTNEDASYSKNIVVVPKVKILSGKSAFVWETECRPSKNKNGKTPARNVIHIKPGPTVQARGIVEPIDCFTLFLSDNIRTEILQHTNEEISRQKQKYTKVDGNIQDVCVEEFDALFGILILSAALKDNHLSTKLMFDSTFCGERYRATMPKKRFEFLINCLRFDNKDTREERKQGDKLAAVRSVWEMLLENCRKLYEPNYYVTIDEQLVGFRGKCPFRMFIPSKPNKYGIKIVMMCDNSTKYMIDACPYLGKGTVPSNVPAAEFFVNQLVQTIRCSNRNVTMANWFTSIPLVEKLLQEKLTVIGTIRKNKKEMPPEFTDLKYENRKAGSSLFLFHEDIIAVSYKAKENKLVSLVSTMHETATVNNETKKPDIIMVYNATKGAVDSFDQICNNTNIGRKTKRWPLCFFYNMMNISLVNSYVIYVHNFFASNGETSRRLSRQEFLLRLHRQMTERWQKIRLDRPQISRDLRTSICRALGIEKINAAEIPNQQGPRKYCALCHYTKKRLTTTYCTCGRPICGKHQKKLCPEC